MRVPENVWVKLTFYAISDSTGLNAAISVEGCRTIDEDELLNRSNKIACDTLNSMLDVEDARPMTAEEVNDYRENEEKESRSIDIFDDNYFE